MRAAALRGLDAVEHSRAQQGVRELHDAAAVDDARAFGLVERADVEFEPVEELRERRRERRAECDEHECGATVGGQRDDPTSDQSGEGGADRWRVVEGSAALPLRGVERAIELHQGQRISADRRHAGLRHVGLDRRAPTEQLGRRRAVESAELEHRERRRIERAVLVRAEGNQRNDWIRFDPMQREHDRIDRRGIDPLRVIDQEQERFVLRGVGEEREDAGANREPIAGTGSRAHASSAVRCESDSPTMPAASGSSRSASTAKARCDSPWRPRTATTRKPVADSAAAASRVVFPIPASPRMINTEPRPARASVMRSSTRRISSTLPRSGGRDTSEVTARSVRRCSVALTSRAARGVLPVSGRSCGGYSYSRARPEHRRYRRCSGRVRRACSPGRRNLIAARQRSAAMRAPIRTALIVGIVTVAVAILLSGCGSAGEQTQASSSASRSTSTTLPRPLELSAVDALHRRDDSEHGPGRDPRHRDRLLQRVRQLREQVRATARPSRTF